MPRNPTNDRRPFTYIHETNNRKSTQQINASTTINAMNGIIFATEPIEKYQVIIVIIQIITIMTETFIIYFILFTNMLWNKNL